MMECKTFQIELTKAYGITEFREDLKKMFAKAGVEGLACVFLFTDTQIIDEGFLEDVNNLLNSGEVPGMYEQDEKDRICNDMRPVCEALGIPGGCAAAARGSREFTFVTDNDSDDGDDCSIDEMEGLGGMNHKESRTVSRHNICRLISV